MRIDEITNVKTNCTCGMCNSEVSVSDSIIKKNIELTRENTDLKIRNEELIKLFSTTLLIGNCNELE